MNWDIHINEEVDLLRETVRQFAENDIAPIADLYKTEVWELGKFLGIDQGIIEAQPTDGLWDDARTDEDQLGVPYAALEEAMEYGTGSGVEVLKKFNTQNQHKMQPIPTFLL